MNTLETRSHEAGVKAGRAIVRAIRNSNISYTIVMALVIVGLIGHSMKPSTPTTPTINVIAVNYQHSEYTAITRIDGVGRVKIVAHCPFTCPSTLGTYAAGPDSIFYRPNLISQTKFDDKLTAE
jgi:hypothetical protein